MNGVVLEMVFLGAMLGLLVVFCGKVRQGQ